MNLLTQACASCGTQAYEFGFCAHCGAPLCPSCIRKNDLVIGLGVGHVSHSIPIPIFGMTGRAIRTGFGYHRIDTLDFPFPHCPKCIESHVRMARLVLIVSFAVGSIFFGLILWGMLAGSGYNWNNLGIYAILSSVLGGIMGFITYTLIKGLPYRQEVIRCPRCGQNIQSSFVAQGLSGQTIIPHGSETIGIHSETYMAGLNTDSASKQIADHVRCPRCGYEGPVRERIGLYKFIMKNGVAVLQGTMWENIINSY